ncbi:MAG: HNH endonuclease [Candidatus Hydrogenedentes bacterium]|nr:HNH endonuclease [Candidatus Hydrogenedentota bacterium]
MDDDLHHFQVDIQESSDKLLWEQKIGKIASIVTLGFFANRSRITEAQRQVDNCVCDLTAYKKLLSRNCTLDVELNSIVLRGVRVCEFAFADVPVEVQCDYGADWLVLRDAILERDSYQCQEEDGCCNGPLQIHHIVPLSRGGNNAQQNLVTLCYYHHSLKHEHMRR